MHYPDESYVRKYPRKTLTSKLLRWEGRAVLDAMLGEFDRAGVFELAGDPAECIATVTEIPIEVVRVALERIVATRTWSVTPSAIVWPNFVEAQTCGRSDRERQRASRERRAAAAANGGAVASRDDDGKQEAGNALPVTDRHGSSRNVTPSFTVPNRSSLSERAHARETDRGQAEPAPEPEREPAPEPKPARRSGSSRRWPRFPPGWRWSPETTAAALALGLTTSDLQAHVAYWTTHPFAVPVGDLDGELCRGLDGIVERKRKAGGAHPGAPPSLDPYRWTPTAAHRALAKASELDLRHAADAYRATGAPEQLGTLRANEDFARRLRCWSTLGGAFVASGRLPRPVTKAG